MKAWFAKNQKIFLRLAGSVLAIGALLLIINQEGWSEIAIAVKQIPPDVFFISAAFMLISRIFVSGRWYVLLRGADIRVSFWRVVLMTFTGLFSSNFLPTTIGGDVIRLAAIMSMGYDRARCLASLAADRLVGMAGMTLTLPFGLIPIMKPGTGASLMSFSLVALWQRGRNFIQRTLRATSIYLQKPFLLLLSLASTLGNMFCIFFAIYFLVLGLNENVSYWTVVGLYSISYFITLVPISINGLGVQELSLSYLFSALGGLSMSASLTLAVLIRAAFLFASLPGAAALPSVMSQVRGMHLKEELP